MEDNILLLFEKLFKAFQCIHLSSDMNMFQLNSCQFKILLLWYNYKCAKTD